MAKNEVLYDAANVVVNKQSVASGDPVGVGATVTALLTGVALVAASATTPYPVTIRRQGVFNLSVKGIDGGGNSAVALYDAIYYVEADTPKLSKKATGTLFGWALGTVTSGSTTTIPVLLK